MKGPVVNKKHIPKKNPKILHAQRIEAKESTFTLIFLQRGFKKIATGIRATNKVTMNFNTYLQESLEYMSHFARFIELFIINNEKRIPNPAFMIAES